MLTNVNRKGRNGSHSLLINFFSAFFFFRALFFRNAARLLFFTDKYLYYGSISVSMEDEKESILSVYALLVDACMHISRGRYNKASCGMEDVVCLLDDMSSVFEYEIEEG